MNNDPFAEYYQALLERNSQYVGVFYACVKTTGVFCIATCRARKPKAENVEFYDSAKSALLNGYRPCKVCRPTEHVDEPPEPVRQALSLFRDNPNHRLSDQDLRNQGIQPATIRRWFKRHMGLTFQAYQRMHRINAAYSNLKKGHKVIDSAYASGYESLSGFQYSYKKIMNTNPQQSAQTCIIHMHRLTTPIGPMFACATEQGLCLLEFTDRRSLETELNDVQRLLKGRLVNGMNQHIKTTLEQLNAYFEGAQTVFNIPIHAPGTDFQKRVWSGLLDIPFGITRSYKQQAEHIGDVNAVRAVARANGANRISIVIPCHRVIGADGSLTGYGGGLARKKWLLNHEMKDQLLNPV
ncbi:bifunctional transcriptional activator/DNA repair enzyme AdaA [Marinicella sp. W31]|uniref:bifunctional transcriptional activator/DNA repair enzyme AdaA n=1 Tax=Marinicella sp. W31 TaxID=3023713 RepID=UPI0037565642